jgi:uncharacterized protein involved in exopolysaccharide biosynthesis
MLTEGEGDDVSLTPLKRFARRHGRVLGLAIAASLVAGAVTAIALPRAFTSTASFIPQTRSVPSGLATLAAQFGMGTLGAESGRSPAFYADLLTNRTFLKNVVGAQYTFRTKDGVVRADLVTFLKADEDTPEERAEVAARRLQRRIQVSVSAKTNVVTLAVTARYPDLAQQIATRLIGQVDSFNLQSRQSQAKAERIFAEQRLRESRAELRAAEDRLQQFLQQNRQFRSSPELGFLHDRLSRDVTLKQEIFTTLTQAFEQARIEEVRDTPVVTLIEHPTMPARADPRPWGRWISLGLIAGLGLGALAGYWRDRRAALAGR